MWWVTINKEGNEPMIRCGLKETDAREFFVWLMHNMLNTRPVLGYLDLKASKSMIIADPFRVIGNSK